MSRCLDGGLNWQGLFVLCACWLVMSCSTGPGGEKKRGHRVQGLEKLDSDQQARSTRTGRKVATDQTGVPTSIEKGSQDPSPDEPKPPLPQNPQGDGNKTATDTSITTTPMPPPTNPGDAIAALHNPAPATCQGCHEKKRPSATHYPGNDCVMCHKYPSFKGASFLHNPKPTTCETCHARPAQVGRRAYPNQGPPAGFNAQDPKAIGGGHYVGKDCVSCHQTPGLGVTGFVFSHSTPNPGACLPCHYNDGFGEHQNRPYFSEFGTCAGCHPNFDVRTGRNFGRN